MKKGALIIIYLFLCISYKIHAQDIAVTSPDNKLTFAVLNGEKLMYSVKFGDRTIVEPSQLGFELLNEPILDGNFSISNQNRTTVNETWKPVVKLKHAEVLDHYNELNLTLKEKSGAMRQMDFVVRAYNDGIAFRYKLYRGQQLGARKISKELTTFKVPGDPKSWIAEYGGYANNNEDEFFERKLSHLNQSSIAGLPLLMDYGDNFWVAITEANLDNYCAFYIGTNGNQNNLVTKLVPLPGEPETGAKVVFSDEIKTPWRVLMVGSTPGTLIESNIIQNLNEPCAIEDPSWIKPGKSAWDHWWSGEVKMEMPVIKEYIDFASEMGWDYMLVDWQWYGEFNKPEADITTSASQIDIHEVIKYAKSKNVNILLWLYSKDVNRNSAYKKAFPLYRQWGVAGVKIDFMDREDQEMVNWYREIIKAAADNQLLVNFHGAFKPDGIIRTYPNMITREAVMGNEYYKFSDQMNPEHNVTLAFTRMLMGEMDYTPGGFLNVRRDEFKQQSPTLVWNTRAAELAKFVIYESPLTVICDHPKYILNQPGSDFLKIVPTIWDETRFLAGYPGEYVAMARKNSDTWYLGVLNNSVGKKVQIKLDFLPEGIYEMEVWADTKKSNRDPKTMQKRKLTVKTGSTVNIDMSDNGGYVAVLRKK
jgi:alpha-glucosidase